MLHCNHQPRWCAGKAGTAGEEDSSLDEGPSDNAPEPIKWGEIYELAIQAGIPVRAVPEHTLAEFIYSLRGWQRKRGIDPDKRPETPMSRDRMNQLFEAHDEARQQHKKPS